MLLVIDVGNTHTVLGVFQENKRVCDWRIRTVRETTADEFNILVRALFNDKSLDFCHVQKTVISCVVPPAVRILEGFCRKYLSHAPIWINPATVRGLMPIRYNNPAEVGADRIVNAIAAYDKYRQGLIVIDFGTATTFDVISNQGEYLGGVIVPGIMISSEALFQKASRLPRVEIFMPPSSVIGRDTIDSIKSGLMHGNAAMVDGMVARMKKELDYPVKVIATGGLAVLIADLSDTVEAVDTRLTLDGLRIITRELETRN